MTSKFSVQRFGAFVLPTLLAFSSLPASIISVNFVGGSGTNGTPSPMAPTEEAGAPSDVTGLDTFVTNWNNAAGSTGSLSGLSYDDGSVSGTDLNWVSGIGTWSLPVLADNPGNDRLMKGYLDADANASTITVSGIDAGADGLFDVVVYFDGANAGDWRVASIDIGGTVLGGEDSENTDFNVGGQNPDGLFQIPVAGAGGNMQFPTSPNNREGNVVVFTGLSGDSFSLAVSGTASGSGLLRGPVNGFQIVGVAEAIPEPSTVAMMLGGFAALLVVFIRRRNAS